MAGMSDLPPVGCELTDPMAQLLFGIATTGTLRPAAEKMKYRVEERFRCRQCRSQWTRFQIVAMLECGFRLRCCSCCRLADIHLPSEQAAA